MGRRHPRAVRTAGAAAALLLVAAVPAVDRSVPVAADHAVVQPGRIFVTDDGGGCTVGFLLDELAPGEDGPVDTGQDWFLTAGHCFVQRGVTQSWDHGDGPRVSDGEQEYGEVVFARTDWDAGVDVALVRFTVGADRYDPTVCFWGGPTHVALDAARPGEELRITGAGSGPLLRARTLEAVGDQQLWVRYRGRHGSGDSGSPVLDADGGALGIHVIGGAELPGDPLDVSTGKASILIEMIELLEGELDTDFEVMTAPLRDEPWPEGTLTEGCGAPVELP